MHGDIFHFHVQTKEHLIDILEIRANRIRYPLFDVRGDSK